MANLAERVAAALQRGHRFVVRDVWRIGRPGEEIPAGFIIKQIRVFILLFTNLTQGKIMLRAAALTFATILSVVPFLAIMFYVIQAFNLGEGVYASLQTKLENAVARAAEVLEHEKKTADDAVATADESGAPDTTAEVAESPDAETADMGESPERAVERGPPLEGVTISVPAMVAEREEKSRELQGEMIKAFFRGVGQQEEGMEDPVAWLVALADEAAADRRALSIAGIVLVFTTVFGLMRNIEVSFNDIWGVKRTRGWYRMISDYVMITLLLPFVAAAVLGITAALQSESIVTQLGPLAYSLQAMQYLAICLVFAALYYIVPNTRVKAVYAMLGGLVAGFMWITLSWAYVEFQVGLARYNMIFSTFAQFPMLLMWVYLSWGILLFGTELSFAYQNERTFAMERFAENASFAYREALGVRMMIEVGRRFAHGLPAMSRETASEEWNVPTRLVNEALDNLEDAGLITPCATDPVTYQPSRPIEDITVGEVVATIRELGEDPSLLRDDPIFRPIYGGLDNTDALFGGATVAQLVERVSRSEPALKIAEKPESEEKTVHDGLGGV